LNEQVCAVVVTYHPDSGVEQNLAATRAQVQWLVVVDNGSPEVELQRLRAWRDAGGFELIENGANLGIATALNVGIRRGEALGAEAFLLLDQDGRIPEGYVAAMSACLAASEGVGILAPRMVDDRFEIGLHTPRTAENDLEVAITSGSMVPRSVFERVGYHRDELFIDQVDSDFSLRVRAAGLRISECDGAVLRHAPGMPTYHRLLGSKPFQVANYSPMRRYYQGRNIVWLWRTYRKHFPAFVRSQVLLHAKDFAKIAWERDRFAKGSAFVEGVWDGVRGRMGARS